MSNTKITLENQNQVHIVHIEGAVDENFSQHIQGIPSAGQIEFVLEKLKSINSTGIREWIKLMQKLGSAQVGFAKCPKIFIDQLNMVSGFIPAKSIIKSFYVPYFNEDQEKEIRVLYSNGIDYSGSQVKIQDTYKDPQGLEYEIDVVKSKYFKFLGV